MSRCTIVDVCRTEVASQTGKRQRALLVHRLCQPRLERAKRRQLGHEAAARRLDPRCRGRPYDVSCAAAYRASALRSARSCGENTSLPEQLDGDQLAAPRAGEHDARWRPPPILHRHVRQSRAPSIAPTSTRIGASSPTDSSSIDALIAMLGAVVNSITTMCICSAADSGHALAVDDTAER
jgi:hypothetical protein